MAALYKNATVAANRGTPFLKGVFSPYRPRNEQSHCKAVHEAHVIAQECAFDLRFLYPELPPYPLPEGQDEDSYLRLLALQGAQKRYGEPAHAPAAHGQIDYELGVIRKLGFAGYFLIVHDIVEFCRRSDILCQGRRSAKDFFKGCGNATG